MTDLSLNYDQFLIVGDFNMHVCCESKPFPKVFLNLIDSFNLIQLVSGVTREKGHTLDLMLSYGLEVNMMEICETHFSDLYCFLDFFGFNSPVKAEAYKTYGTTLIKRAYSGTHVGALSVSGKKTVFKSQCKS